ncbi:SMP-30/gluconolactonase/LRE family protein [Microbacterium sp. zg-Y818]|uniref:SMP-30/gluconolactonase/LRE family protein n=1 Tax=unclassified Microbacterium TaxID=2609290 RepID=UPI00214ADF86|nr:MULTISPECIES: SMP-30/gluconolactonase/LRE family protein [unclassified Microbacterium]MCR2799367.1 SMP-30/gluconolactonase/LRE family protein [Microbacterium sp. zg.Y818]WIM21366.1 SMP-30/gluconolactonase/LRE family protein [Microbacterium sp. zg-Y818]
MADGPFDGAEVLPATQLVSGGLSWPEAPRWHDGALHVSDMYAGRVVRIGDDGSIETVVDATTRETLDGVRLVTIGTGWLPDGRLLINSMDEKVVLVWDGESLDVYADLREIARSPINDMVVDGRGRAYVTQMGFDLWAGELPEDSPIIVIEPDGSARVLESAGDFGAANGIGITADGKTVITAENFGVKISAFDLDDAGEAVNRRVLAATPPISPGVGPDGIAVDELGGVWYGLPGSEHIVHITAAGVMDYVVRLPWEDGIGVACALGGPDRRTLYITAGQEVMDGEKSVAEAEGTIWTVQVPVGAGTALP